MTLRHRIASITVLAVFLAAQAWMVCPMLCLHDAAASAGSSQPAMAGMGMGVRGSAYCHPRPGLTSRIPAVQQDLSPMLTATAPSILLAGRQVPYRVVVGLPRLSSPFSAADPPPPRPV